MKENSWIIKLQVFFFQLIFKPWIRRSARHIIQGRLLDPANPEHGRWLRSDINRLLSAIWKRTETLTPSARLHLIPTLGNRINVYLAIITTASYQMLLKDGHSKTRSADLTADVGWKIYERAIGLISLPFRLTSKNPAHRIERTVRAMLIFPFSAPGRPGYEVKVRKNNGVLHTDWTWCPPQAFVRTLTEEQGDNGELDAFYASWCLYDWPGADVMAANGKRDHYARKKTLSRGDKVCDMCWKFNPI